MTVEVHFALIGSDDAPIPNATVRLMLGDASDHARPEAGTRFTTDANGQHQCTVPVSPRTRRRKRPTNFFTQLFSLREKTHYLKISADVVDAGITYRYVIELDRFPDGANLYYPTEGRKVVRLFLSTEDGARWTMHLTLQRHIVQRR